MNILSIGNSFSQDAHKWLSRIARGCGDDLLAANLYIGGCSLQTHWENFVSGAADYDLELNGEFVRKISIPEALELMNWDVITFQQASHFSGDYSTYVPYLTDLFTAVKARCPEAAYYIHQTWSYEHDSTHPGFLRYDCSQEAMYTMLTQCYTDAAAAIGARLLPVGTLIQYLRENTAQFDYAHGGLSLCRDGFHLSWLYGRYAAALLWYCVLFQKPVPQVCFLPTADGETADAALLQCVHDAVDAFMRGNAKKL